MSTTPREIARLAQSIAEAAPGDPPIETPLSTSGRVLRRVTDGIYREPWSALRELVSNAYDADATRVLITTDAPRFKKIVINDNGMGFSAESLASMIKSIGGSPKRQQTGIDLGVTSESDKDLSPKGRKLIGKLGIGLFALSQLTHEFQIVTKRRGEDTQTIADVVLFRYAEGMPGTQETDGEVFQTGSVKLSKLPARSKNTQGTEIVLRNLLPRTRAELASEDMWTMVRAPKTANGAARDPVRHPPRYHLGLVGRDGSGEFVERPRLPWAKTATPEQRFRQFVDRMYERADEPGNVRPSLENTFDNYLQFLWHLSLAAPLDYLDCHPFDLDGSSGLRVFQLGNNKGDGATELRLKPREKVRDVLGLKAPERGSNLEFEVIVDGVSLKRPIRFKNLPKTAHSVEQPLLFVGKDSPDLSKYPSSVSGGERLSFEAYLLWCPRVVPVEHNGVLVRVNDASGTLFDQTFMRYQVSEQTRLRQVMSEVFVNEGLDAALSLDRETFNVAHPHYQYLASWVHNAFRQFATRHKDLAKVARAARIADNQAQGERELAETVDNIVYSWTGGESEPLAVDFAESLAPSVAMLARNAVVFSEDIVFSSYPKGQRSTRLKSSYYETDQAVLRAVIQVLTAAGAFDNMDHDVQQKLVMDLSTVIFFHRRGGT